MLGSLVPFPLGFEPPSAPFEPPPLPTVTGLTATLVAGPQVNLAWEASLIGDETGFSIERRDVRAGPAFAEIDTVGVNIEVYEGDVGAFTAGDRYEWRVVVVGGASDGLASNVVSLIPIPSADRRRRLAAAL